MGYKRRSDRAELNRVLASCGVDWNRVRRVEELTEGTFNTAYRIRMADNSGMVLKISPRPDTPILSYEQGLMYAEATFYRAAAIVERVRTPVVVHADFDHVAVDGDILLMSECPGHTWHSQRDRLDEADRIRLRAELGRMVAALHQVAGDGFGYPRGIHSPLSRTWPEAFHAMFNAVLADAERFAAPLPARLEDLAGLVPAHADLLAEVETPALVHFDLWDGNILVDFANGRPEIGGLIDGERVFFGDPIAEFASLALFGDIEADVPFLTGYQESGAKIVFDDRIRRRLALYRCYLYLIMLVESVPRDYPAAQRAKLHRLVFPRLRSELAALVSGRT